MCKIILVKLNQAALKCSEHTHFAQVYVTFFVFNTFFNFLIYKVIKFFFFLTLDDFDGSSAIFFRDSSSHGNLTIYLSIYLLEKKGTWQWLWLLLGAVGHLVGFNSRECRFTAATDKDASGPQRYWKRLLITAQLLYSLDSTRASKFCAQFPVEWYHCITGSLDPFRKGACCLLNFWTTGSCKLTFLPKKKKKKIKKRS